MTDHYNQRTNDLERVIRCAGCNRMVKLEDRSRSCVDHVTGLDSEINQLKQQAFTAGKAEGYREGMKKAALIGCGQSLLATPNRTARWTAGYNKACEDCGSAILTELNKGHGGEGKGEHE